MAPGPYSQADLEQQGLADAEKRRLVTAAGGNSMLSALAARGSSVYFGVLASLSILSALGFSALQERVFRIEGFQFAGWMTFLTYVTYATCGWVETVITNNYQRHGRLMDYALVSILAMLGTYFTNWALEFLNYTTRIVFKSCRVLPVMGFRTLVVGQRYSLSQYGAGAVLVVGISLFTMGDKDGMPNFHWLGVLLISVALVCDALTSNLEERQFFRIKTPASHAEVMTYLSMFGALGSFFVLYVSGELWPAIDHSFRHRETVPCICAFSSLGYITVSLILLIIKSYGSTSAEIVKSMRKVCQVALSFILFPKPLSWKYMVGGAFVTFALYVLQKSGKKPMENGKGEKDMGGEKGSLLDKGLGSPLSSRSPKHSNGNA